MQQLRILIVEDNSLVAEDIALTLEEIGFMVADKVKSGEEAVISASKNNPDLIIMDINLRGKIDGIEATAQIKRFLNVPIIFLTAYEDDKTFERAKATTPYAYITKPFEERDLSRAIDLAINCFSVHQKYDSNQILNEHHLINDAIFVKEDKRYIKIPVDSIKYLVADGSYLNLVTLDSEFLMSMNLHAFESKIQHNDLMRIHRSYIVNLKKVESFTKNYLIIDNKTFTISKPFQAAFHDRFMTT